MKVTLPTTGYWSDYDMPMDGETIPTSSWMGTDQTAAAEKFYAQLDDLVAYDAPAARYEHRLVWVDPAGGRTVIAAVTPKAGV